MSKKLSDKDKKDWQKFLSNKEKLPNKDQFIKKNVNKNIIKIIDLHGYSLDIANKTIEEFIVKSFKDKVSKIIVITGKGNRSKNKLNPYVSNNLSILKYSVPEYIESNKNLMKIIREISEAQIEDGGAGAFCIYLKKNNSRE